MATTSQPNQETQELTRLYYQTKKTLPILSCKDMTDESFKPVLNIFAGYEQNNESLPFSTNDANDVTPNLINVSNAVQDPKYHDNPTKPII